MRILSFKPGHDGQVALLRGGRLEFSIEAEKDNGARYAPVSPSTLLSSFPRVGAPPDVVALSGWTADFHRDSRPIGAGYFGHAADGIITGEIDWFGTPAHYFSSSHERSHLMCAYGLSPFPQGQSCYALIWESEFGAFYHLDQNANVRKLADVLSAPGLRYSMLYALGDPSFRGRFRMEDAGKLMALAGYGQRATATAAESTAIERLLTGEITTRRFDKADFTDLPYHDIGLTHPDFTDLARRFSDALFARFLSAAEQLELDPSLPLLIAGGCGLNCEWNSAWRRSGRFSDVFVPPCCNDSGAAIGTAIDAQRHFTGNAKLEWSVYAGEEFNIDLETVPGYAREPLSPQRVAERLAAGDILGWVQGRYEIGPRALGNRSLLAAPFRVDTRDRLNRIKEREGFRPIAPICLEEDIGRHFSGDGASPYMLHFHEVTDARLAAVTHADGSARVQTVTREQNAPMHALLQAFRAATGVGVLCNTSLNFKGAGFINRLSDLAAYAQATKLDGFAVGDRLYLRQPD